ncbi:DUF4962 domain-containing protein [Occultella aeris]|uniref:Heparinase II N-terminal domain-containing protein n=1 Tax=Occultella aeris TaxID=2761496 RepID=A0A7M4DFF3_9MICO|nr:DUF4962 domain-containing protein [Occultella aeris]VZO35646.1 hypothetical protein HALOF300_00844 [Occultella aeris]
MTTPTLLLDGHEDRLCAEAHGVRARQFRRLLEECERYRSEGLPTEHPSASITYLGAAAANLALAYRITGQGHYLSELRRWLAVPVGFAHWGRAHMPDHDLDAGWLLHGLGLAYSWAGSALPADERTALRDKLILQGARMYEFAVSTEGQWWSSSYWQNHNWICYAGLATAGYAVTAEHPAARDWTERAKANFDTVLDMLPADGSNSEGVVYWRYGEPWLVSYLDVLRSAEGLDWFGRSDHLRETFWYRLYQAAPDLERIVDHGDCHDRRSGHPVAMYYKLASEYGIGQAQWLAEQVTESFLWREAYESGVRPGIRAEAYQEFLWYDPNVEPVPPDDLPTSRHFPDLGLVVGRTSWAEDATLVSFKASPGGGHKAWDTSHDLLEQRGWVTLNAGHHHPDSGTFVLLGEGSYLAVDEGYSSRKRTEHHNAVLVDGNGYVNEDRYHVYKDLDREYTARIVTTTLGAGWTHAVSEVAAMYDRALGVRRVRRHLVLTPGGVLVLVDDLAADAPREWTWLLQTDNPAWAREDGLWQADAGRGVLRVHACAPDDVRTDVVATPIHANPTSSTPSLAIEKVQHTLRRTTGLARAATFVSVLEPRPWAEADGGARVRAHTEGRVVRVEMIADGVTDTVLLDLDGAAVPGAGAAVVGEGFAGWHTERGGSDAAGIAGAAFARAARQE